MITSEKSGISHSSFLKKELSCGMPWNGNGYDKKFTVSLYCKDELPTWAELYNDFWMKKTFNYDSKNIEHQTLDQYWKIPYRKILLAQICNQLNKMIFEDDVDVISFLNTTFKLGCTDFRYLLMKKDSDITGIDKTLMFAGLPPQVYTCKIPSTGNHSIFITNKHPRIDIDDLDDQFQLVGIVDNDLRSIKPDNKDIFMSTIEFIILEAIKYFEDGIGWKDGEGNIIPSDPLTNRCAGVGIDPAL